jgi:hypothetical protein
MYAYEVRPCKDHRGVDLISDALPFGRLCARHTAIAETAARPSHGRRSRNVMTMVALS